MDKSINKKIGNGKKIAIALLSITVVILAAILMYSYVENKNASAVTQATMMQQDEQITKLQEQISELQIELAAKQKALDEALAKIAELQKEIDLLKETIKLQTGTPTPTPPAQSKPNQPATSKPATSKPSTEKPKPSTPAPTYTNIFGETYVCDGKEQASGPANPPSLPPSDGDRWVWNMLKDEWYWSESDPSLEGGPNGGQIGEAMDSGDSPPLWNAQ